MPASQSQMRDFPCDVCGADDAVEIPEARRYTGNQPIHVCRRCGFVHCRRRRSAAAIAATWNDELYGAANGDSKGRGELGAGVMTKYSALTPYAKARQTFVLETIAQSIGLEGKRVIDIGAGQGEFLDVARKHYGAKVFGLEPSPANCRRMDSLGIPNFVGIVEDYVEQGRGQYDIATIVWTLENCESCRRMVDAAYSLLAPGGHVVIATGSRILVPFKKPLQYFFNPNIPQDAHPFYFSFNSLNGLLAGSGFRLRHVNRYIDSDYLVVTGEKTDRSQPLEWQRDDANAVLDFFRRWAAETDGYYRNA